MSDAHLPATLVRIYEDPQAAEQARQALVNAGFTPGQVQLWMQGDEAGALAGNFLVGNPKTGAAADGGYSANFEKVLHPQTCVLTVHADAAGQPQASALLSAFGGLEVDDLARGRRGTGRAGA